MSDRSSRESAASTSASSEPVTSSRSSAKPMSGDAAYSPHAGLGSPASPMFGTFVRTGIRRETDDIDTWTEQDHTNALVAEPLNGIQGHTLISSAEVSPAKTSALPGGERDSKPESAAASSSSVPASLTLFSPMADGSCLRTFPDFFPATVAEISLSYSRRWPTSGFTTSPGECWTADTSECPNAGGVSSSLRDVLEDDVPARYFLSPRAAAGIIRRAEKRGRELPEHLASALRSVATPEEPANSTTRTTS